MRLRTFAVLIAVLVICHVASQFMPREPSAEAAPPAVKLYLRDATGERVFQLVDTDQKGMTSQVIEVDPKTLEPLPDAKPFIPLIIGPPKPV